MLLQIQSVQLYVSVFEVRFSDVIFQTLAFIFSTTTTIGQLVLRALLEHDLFLSGEVHRRYLACLRVSPLMISIMCKRTQKARALARRTFPHRQAAAGMVE